MRNFLSGVGRVSPADDQHSVTTFELFFDLVFVFAITQLTGYMAHAHSWTGMLQGLLLLGLLWWVWAGYTWLGNQARADEGAVRAGMSLAMMAMFLVALTIPEAWDDAPGGLNGPLVLVGAYITVRLIHLGVYSIAALDDDGLIHQLAVTLIPLLAGSSLLVAGALIGGTAQTLLFAAGLVLEWLGTYLTARGGGGWRIHSPGHWTERHGLFMILAIGESVVAIGVGAAELAISAPLAVAAGMGVAVSICFWWLYFDIVSLAGERSLQEVTGAERVKLAIDAYSYLHYPMVAGIILAALGVEEVLAHVDSEGLGYFAAVGLFGGPALYLLGHVAFKRRLHPPISVLRSGTALLLLAAIPLGSNLAPLAALALLLVVLGALVAVETARYSEVRRELRSSE